MAKITKLTPVFLRGYDAFGELMKWVADGPPHESRTWTVGFDLIGYQATSVPGVNVVIRWCDNDKFVRRVWYAESPEEAAYNLLTNFVNTHQPRPV